MNTIRVSTRPYLLPFTIELIEKEFIGHEDYSILFECIAESYAHAVDQALDAHPDATILGMVDYD